MSMFLDTAFKKVNRNEGGVPRSYAEFQCSKCPATLGILMRPGVHMAPIHYAKAAIKEGWEADPRKKYRVLCPDCQGVRPVNDPDSEIKKLNVTMNGSPAPHLTPAAPETPAKQPQATAAPVSTIEPQSVAVNRDPTTEQRIAIRAALDQFFDDEIGMFSEGMDDERIAVKIGVPRIFVERIRESAYGPIKVDPAMAGFRAEITQLKRELGVAADLIMKLQQNAAGISSRIERKLVGKL